jgi:hypothetical protein
MARPVCEYGYVLICIYTLASSAGLAFLVIPVLALNEYRKEGKGGVYASLTPTESGSLGEEASDSPSSLQ